MSRAGGLERALQTATTNVFTAFVITYLEKKIKADCVDVDGFNIDDWIITQMSDV